VTVQSQPSALGLEERLRILALQVRLEVVVRHLVVRDRRHHEDVDDVPELLHPRHIGRVEALVHEIVREDADDFLAGLLDEHLVVDQMVDRLFLLPVDRLRRLRHDRRALRHHGVVQRVLQPHARRHHVRDRRIGRVLPRPVLALGPHAVLRIALEPRVDLVDAVLLVRVVELLHALGDLVAIDLERVAMRCEPGSGRPILFGSPGLRSFSL
jgi:hypothetical protein